MKQILFAVALGVALSGCQLTRVEGEIEDVSVKVSTNDSHDAGYKFCPPGQAKKGTCE